MPARSSCLFYAVLAHLEEVPESDRPALLGMAPQMWVPDPGGPRGGTALAVGDDRGGAVRGPAVSEWSRMLPRRSWRCSGSGAARWAAAPPSWPHSAGPTSPPPTGTTCVPHTLNLNPANSHNSRTPSPGPGRSQMSLA